MSNMKPKKNNNFDPTPNSLVLEITYRFMAPVFVVYALYVLLHGEYSPGGGFQAGVIFAFSVLINRTLNPNKEISSKSRFVLIACAGLGAFFYACVGIATIIGGGNFLEYTALPLFWIHPVERHVAGILLIEIGVTVGVMCTIISIFDSLGKVGEQADDSSRS